MGQPCLLDEDTEPDSGRGQAPAERRLAEPQPSSRVGQRPRVTGRQIDERPELCDRGIRHRQDGQMAAAFLDHGEQYRQLAEFRLCRTRRRILGQALHELHEGERESRPRRDPKVRTGAGRAPEQAPGNVRWNRSVNDRWKAQGEFRGVRARGRRRRPHSMTTNVLAPLRVLGTCAVDAEPWDLTPEHIALACDQFSGGPSAAPRQRQPRSADRRPR